MSLPASAVLGAVLGAIVGISMIWINHGGRFADSTYGFALAAIGCGTFVAMYLGFKLGTPKGAGANVPNKTIERTR